MKVRDLIEQEICVDVYDDVCEELGIAFDGPLTLTEAGREKFAEVLDYDVKILNNGYDTVAIVNVDAPDGIWEKRLRRAIVFFDAAAGYCAADDYKKWFVQ